MDNLKCYYWVLFFIAFSTTAHAQLDGFAIRFSGGTSMSNLNGLQKYYHQRSSESENFQYDFRNHSRTMLAFSLEYLFSSHHGLLLELDYISMRPTTNVTVYGRVLTYMEIPDIDYRIQSLAVTLGYRHTFRTKFISPFVAFGISYLPVTVKKLPQYTMPWLRESRRQQFHEQSYAANLLLGFMMPLSKRWDIQPRATYRYSSQLRLDEEKFDLSGFYFLAGLGYTF